MKRDNRISALKSINWKLLIAFCVYFILQFKSINQNFFDTDEFDIFVGGEAICRGAWLYRDFFSQHMPFSYYISSFFWLLGAHTVLLQRVYFYAAFSAIWTFIIKRYSAIADYKCLAAYPVIFIMMINCCDMGTSILSEHLNAVGVVLLMLEFRLFLKNDDKNISLSSSIIISSVILLTFGTTFVSAFLLAAVVLMVLFGEICTVRKHQLKGKELFTYLVNKYKRLIICCAAPWVILVLVYAAAGVLDDFYYGAYYINRTFYSKYLGGYGDNILLAAYGGVPSMANYFISSLSSFFDGTFEFKNFVLFLSFCIAAGYIIYHFIAKNKKEAVLWVLMLAEAATRGVFNFHSTHFTAIIALLCAMCFFDNKASKECSAALPNMAKAAKYISLGIISSVYISGSSALFSVSFSSQPSEMGELMRITTEENEGIWCCMLGYNGYFIESGRYQYRAIAVPWFWDAYGQQLLDDFGDEPPRICLFSDNLEVWGNNVKNYAPELVQYINDHYIHFKSYFYIRKDYFEEAVSRIDQSDADITYSTVTYQEELNVIEVKLKAPTNSFTEVLFPTWSIENGQDDIVWYPAENNEDNSWTCSIDLNDHHSSGEFAIHIYGKTESGEMQFIDALSAEAA